MFKDAKVSREHVRIKARFCEGEIRHFQTNMLTKVAGIARFICDFSRGMLYFDFAPRRCSPEKYMWTDPCANQRAAVFMTALSLTRPVSDSAHLFCRKVQKNQAYRLSGIFQCFFLRSMGRPWVLTWTGFWNQWMMI